MVRPWIIISSSRHNYIAWESSWGGPTTDTTFYCKCSTYYLSHTLFIYISIYISSSPSITITIYISLCMHTYSRPVLAIYAVRVASLIHPHFHQLLPPQWLLSKQLLSINALHPSHHHPSSPILIISSTPPDHHHHPNPIHPLLPDLSLILSL